jgi:hypothetical protein
MVSEHPLAGHPVSPERLYRCQWKTHTRLRATECSFVEQMMQDSNERAAASSQRSRWLSLAWMILGGPLFLLHAASGGSAEIFTRPQRWMVLVSLALWLLAAGITWALFHLVGSVSAA